MNSGKLWTMFLAKSLSDNIICSRFKNGAYIVHL